MMKDTIHIFYCTLIDVGERITRFSSVSYRITVFDMTRKGPDASGGGELPDSVKVEGGKLKLGKIPGHPTLCMKHRIIMGSRYYFTSDSEGSGSSRDSREQTVCKRRERGKDSLQCTRCMSVYNLTHRNQP